MPAIAGAARRNCGLFPERPSNLSDLKCRNTWLIWSS